MSRITIEKAAITDAEQLTFIKKRTFDAEVQKWLPNQKNGIDYNIQPPGYASVEMTAYMINELTYFKVLFDKEIVGGIVLTISGTSYGRIDRIFIDPNFQGQGIGSSVMKLIEEEYPYVQTWDLETSSRQLNNHHFYEKMGYLLMYKSTEEYGYHKKIALDTETESENVVENKKIGHDQYENCDMAKTQFYQVNLEGSSLSNSNLANNHISNCNFSQAKFQNINFRNSLFADLNLSGSKLLFVTLGGVRFMNTDLGNEGQSITFDSCDLSGSQFRQCNLKNVEIQNSDLTGMKINNIAVEELMDAYYRINGF